MTKKILLFVASFVSFSAYGSQVSFDLRKAIAGADCATQDLSRPSSQLRVLTSSKTITVVTKALSMDLLANGGGLAVRKACSIRIPAKIQAGYTIKSITQRATYGVYKTDGATLALSFRSASVGNGALLSKSFSRESSVDQPLASAVSKTVLSSDEQASLCSDSDFIQKVDLSAAAQLFDFSAQTRVGRLGSGDVKLDISLELVRCASR